MKKSRTIVKLDENQLKRITNKIDLLTKVTVLTFLRDKTLKEKVKILTEIGLRPNEIAKLLGKKLNVITARLSEIRRGKK